MATALLYHLRDSRLSYTILILIITITIKESVLNLRLGIISVGIMFRVVASLSVVTLGDMSRIMHNWHFNYRFNEYIMLRRRSSATSARGGAHAIVYRISSSARSFTATAARVAILH
jgi:hypothetical protein